MTIRHCWLAGAALTLGADSPVAQDLERERRLTTEIADAIFDGEPIHLEADGLRFFAIYTESTQPEPRGGVILLHGRGLHADWAQVIAPLRVALAERGFHTLSVQMPVLDKEAKYYDYVPILPAAFPRIDAALEFLAEKGIERPVLLAHSCGVHMAMAYVDRFGDERFGAFVGIGMGATDYRQPMREPFPLDRMRIPVADIYGANDFPGVIRNAPRRARAMREAGHARSRQIVVPGADHYFDDRGEALVEVVSEWLDQTLAR